MPKIELRNVSKVFGDNPALALERMQLGDDKRTIRQATGQVVAVNDVTLEIEAGETFVLMGLSGCGKSTLLRHINRLVEPSSGQILVNGTDVMGLSPEQLIELRKNTVSMVFQGFGLFPHRTVAENVSYGLMIQGMPKPKARECAEQWLEDVGLSGTSERYPRELSGGMRQRVGLARALATGSDILLMDEAFSALDPLIRRDMQDLLLELQKKLNRTLVFVTHDLDEALRVGDKIAILREGQVVQVAPPEEILLQPANAHVRDFVANVYRGRVLAGRTVMQRPELVLPVAIGGAEAATRCRDADCSEACVVDGKGALVGVLSAARAMDAQRDSAASLMSYIEPLTVLSETDVLDVILGHVVRTQQPVGLCDEEGVFTGIVTMRGAVEALVGHRV